MLRQSAKTFAARSAARLLPQAQYQKCVFVLSHMRAVTTALTNVLCSHPGLSGYGETHVPHDHAYSVGQLMVNLMRHRAWRPGTMMVDKILHSHLDQTSCAAFYTARAVFLLRAPAPAIASIKRLSAQGDGRLVRDAEAAAHYYLQRLTVLEQHWERFPAERRIGLSSEALLANPDEIIAGLGDWLELQPPLRNRYRAHVCSSRPGRGDPLMSAQCIRIEARAPVHQASALTDVPENLAARCILAHARLLSRFMSEPAGGEFKDFSTPRCEVG